jgi:replication fork clamp-binding protein CrfC
VVNQHSPQCQNLQELVESLLQLVASEPSLRTHPEISTIQGSLKKVISPKFEIVFAGAFSAGKSMSINALIERELLYSAEGHATGTECYIAYAESDRERVVLTFLSVVEIQEQIHSLCRCLGVTNLPEINLSDSDRLDDLSSMRSQCQMIIQQEGGTSKSELGKQAMALMLLLDGLNENRDRIAAASNETYSMEQLDLHSIQDAADYARRGSNSAVLKCIEYYCCHPLLQDGNVLVDLPGIDAPIRKDAELTYRKIENPDTSAVVCILKPASEGEMTLEETELLEKIRSNSGIRDRVFYVFNRIDETWYNAQLRQRLESLLHSDFRDTDRVYLTSSLLGFYGSQIKNKNASDRYGLDSLFALSVRGSGSQEETPQFVYAFNNYCGTSGKLASSFRISINGYETPNENYVRILNECGKPLIDRLIKDSGIEEFRYALTRYLTEEKRPQLFAALASDLQPICVALCRLYQERDRELNNQPHEVEGIKSRRIEQLHLDLQHIGDVMMEYISDRVNQLVTNCDTGFEEDFRKLKVKMVARMDELLNTFSVEEAYQQATKSHPRNATAPLLAILVEAFYYLANELEEVLIAESKRSIANWFANLAEGIREREFYRQLCRLVGTDAGFDRALEEVERQVQFAIFSAARTECDRFVRESPRFYDEGTFSIYQFRQVLQQTSQSYDCASMKEAEPAIRQLLKLDFEPKVQRTIQSTFRQTINQTLKTHLLEMAKLHAEVILQQYSRARIHLEKTLEKEAREQLDRIQEQQAMLGEAMKVYSQSVGEINLCLQAMQLDRYQLPIVDLNSELTEEVEV